MARLPQNGSDNGIWGTVLNDYLLQSHTIGGQLKSGTVTDDTIASNAQIDQSKIKDLNTTFIASPGVRDMVVMTQAAYDALGSPDPETLYLIVG